MRIGILTFHNTPNFGATLQCYALSQHIRALGHEVEVINYAPPKALMMYGKSQFLGRRRAIRNVGKIAEARRFVNETLKLSGPPIYRRDGLKALDDGRYDVVFTGSDEVWKIDHIRPLDGSFYFDFLSPEKTRLCSYSASASTVTDLRDHAEVVGPWLSRMHAIAVRDPHTGEAVAALTGTEPTQVSDPTFLWDFAGEDLSPLHEGRYLALYSWPDARNSAAIREFADREALQIVAIGCHNPLADKNYIAIGPREWLRLIKHSEIVVTDFFHGIIFALLFGRPLFAHVDEKKRMKLHRILSLAGQEDRLHGAAGEIGPTRLDDHRYDPAALNGLTPLIATSKDYIAAQLQPQPEGAP